MKSIASSLVTGIIILAVVFVMVRPGSQGVTLVTNVSNGFKGLIAQATGGGTWAKA